jgi:photosystem II stability/assembly factor-like uncharacterized protein
MRAINAMWFAGLATALAGCPGLTGDGDGGWTAMPLLDDNSTPDNPGWYEGRALVTGVRFTSRDEGVVTVAADNSSGNVGGAIFGARADAVTDIRFSGRDSVCSTGSSDFHGLVATPDGMIALTEACALVASHDGGRTFTGTRMGGGGDTQGLEKTLGLRVTAAGSVIVRDTGVVARSATAPGETAIWEDVWAPDAIPSIPAQVPADQCHDGPVSDQVPVEPQAAYLGPDGGFLAYVADPAGELPQICISRDGGRSFRPTLLDVPSPVAPIGVYFTNDQIGLAWYSNTFSAADTYLRRTTDGGGTWSEVAVPAELAGVRLNLRHLFFAPGGTVGWLVGYNLDTREPLLLKTRDAGATFEVLHSGLAEALPDVRLHTGFALDEDHIWVGGEQGGLAHSSSGGE